jgi:hypothetical protein
MKKEILNIIAILAPMISILPTVNSNLALGDSSDSISFLDSGVTIYSPLNITYAQTPTLQVNLYGAGNFASLDPEISMNYSIDYVYNGSIHLRSDGEIHFITNAIGTAALPELPSGSHCLRIYLYGWNQISYDPRYLSYVDTVDFSIVGGPAPTLAPSPTAPPASSAPTPASTFTPEPPRETEIFLAILGLAVSAGIALGALVLLVYFEK